MKAKGIFANNSEAVNQDKKNTKLDSIEDIRTSKGKASMVQFQL
jgi:hypothetical protein